MTIQPVPEKRYRLYDGTRGTEYEACMEALKSLETQKLHLDEKIELMRKRIEIAEGHPYE